MHFMQVSICQTASCNFRLEGSHPLNQSVGIFSRLTVCTDLSYDPFEVMVNVGHAGQSVFREVNR